MALPIKKVSQITINDIAAYCRIDEVDAIETVQLEALLSAAKDYVCNYTGLSTEEMDDYSDIVTVIYLLCADWYDNRTAVNSGAIKTTINPTVSIILDMHSRNLL